jgi:hypothetical protein
VQVHVSLKGRLGLLHSTSDIGIGGHLVVGVLWRVVSVGSKLLSLYSQMYTCVSGDELLVIGCEGGGGELLGNFVLDSSFTCFFTSRSA